MAYFGSVPLGHSHWSPHWTPHASEPHQQPRKNVLSCRILPGLKQQGVYFSRTWSYKLWTSGVNATCFKLLCRPNNSFGFPCFVVVASAIWNAGDRRRGLEDKRRLPEVHAIFEADRLVLAGETPPPPRPPSRSAPLGRPSRSPSGGSLRTGGLS